jgi:hypothetical protein
MAKIKAGKKSKTLKVPAVKAKKAATSRKLFGGKVEDITFKLNSLKRKKYFPYLMILFVMISLLYFSRSLLFAAFVGGRPITRIQLITELEKQAGQQALDSLITKELLTQEARKKNINITDLEINAEIDRITSIIEAQGTTLETALAMQGQTMSDLEENIKLQKTVERLLADSIVVSDEEIINYFEENKSFYGEGVNFDDIKDSIKDQLVQEKLSGEFQLLLQKLKSEGNIIYFVDFQ